MSGALKLNRLQCDATLTAVRTNNLARERSRARLAMVRNGSMASKFVSLRIEPRSGGKIWSDDRRCAGQRLGRTDQLAVHQPRAVARLRLDRDTRMAARP